MPDQDINSTSNCDSRHPRKRAALELRENEARLACERDPRPEVNQANGDEQYYNDDASAPQPAPTFVANYTKGMQHNKLGEVEPRSQYEALRTAAATGDPADYARIPKADPDGRDYVNPQAAIAFETEGPDAPQAAIFEPDSIDWEPFPQAPTMRSAETAGEMVELYWMMLGRDVAFAEFDASPVITDAVSHLNELTNFQGPRDDSGQVTIQTAFRDGLEGALLGPYLSQLAVVGTELGDGDGFADPLFSGVGGNRAVHPARGITLSESEGLIVYGRQVIDQRVFEFERGRDFMSAYKEWLRVQNGLEPTESEAFTGERRFIYSGRQLGNMVQVDQVYQLFFNAALVLLGRGTPPGPGNPYQNPLIRQANQTGFATWGNAHLLSLLAEVSNRALKAVWYQKWNVHRRLRPETFGGRLHNTLVHFREEDPEANPYELHADILNTDAATKLQDRVWKHNVAQNRLRELDEGSFLHAQGFPEGSPIHPSYGAGHAVIAGACGTFLKAYFDSIGQGWGDVAYRPDRDGKNLQQVSAAGLTIEGEINKLVSNMGQGRNWAGVHYRSDNTWSYLMGEYVAAGILQEQARTFNEPGAFFRFRRFRDNRIMRITRDGVELE